MIQSELSNSYPEIEGNDSNFITDYIAMSDTLDKGLVFQYGKRLFDYYDEITSDSFDNWKEISSSIVLKHLRDWAFLYYTITRDYNPLYNVDGTEETTYGPTKNTNKYGPTSQTNAYGENVSTYNSAEKNTSTTIASRTNSSTDSKKAYPDNALEVTNSVSDTIGGGTDTSKQDEYIDTSTNNAHNDTISTTQHTDEVESIAHTDTLRRYGNIGVTKSSDLVSSEYTLRTKSFWDIVFKTMLMEGGFHYE